MRQGHLLRWGLVGSLFWVLAVRHFAIAEPHMTPEVVELLKNAKLAANTCKQNQENKTSEPQKLSAVVAIKPELPCAILPAELHRLRQSANTALVDTRTTNEYAQFHIDGAMNINASELRGKVFLQDKMLVLIGNGKSEQELYIHCKRLKSNGYKQVKVLWGGMPTWLAAGLGVLGQPPTLAELTKLTAAELWIESQFAANLTLVSNSHGALQKHLRGSLLVADEKPKIIQAAAKQHTKKSKSGALASVILVASKNTDIQAISRAIKLVPLLVYSELPEVFTDQLTQQSAVWSAHARGPKQPSGCSR